VGAGRGARWCGTGAARVGAPAVPVRPCLTGGGSGKQLSVEKGTAEEKGPLRVTVGRLLCQNTKIQLYGPIFIYFSVTNLRVNHKGEQQLKRQFFTFLTGKRACASNSHVGRGAITTHSCVSFPGGRRAVVTLSPSSWRFFSFPLPEPRQLQGAFIFHAKESREEPQFSRCFGARAASSKAESTAFRVVAGEKETQREGGKRYRI